MPMPRHTLRTLALAIAAMTPASNVATAADGDPDPRWSGDGYARIATDANLPVGVACTPNGSCFTAAATTAFDGDLDWEVRRFDAGGAGVGVHYVEFDLGGALQDEPHAIAATADGRVVIAGLAQDSTDPADGARLAVARLAPSAFGYQLDPTFGTGGRATVDFFGSAKASAVAIAPDGSVVLAGTYYTGSGDNFDMVVVRLTPGGQPDPGFDGNGVKTIAFDLGASRHDELLAVVVQPDGRVVASGFARWDADDSDMAVVRLTAAGALDPTFVGNHGAGKRYIAFDLASSADDSGNAVGLDRLGRIVVGGSAAGGAALALQRLTSGGGFDPGLSVVDESVGGADEMLLASLPAGRLIYRAGNLVGARTAAGDADLAFGSNGSVVIDDPGGFNDVVRGLTSIGGQPVVVGQSTTLPSGQKQLVTAKLWTGAIFGDGFEGGNIVPWTGW